MHKALHAVSEQTSRAPISVTVPEAMRITGLGRSSIYRAFDDKRLSRRKAGSRTLILYSELTAFIESLPVANTENPKSEK